MSSDEEYLDDLLKSIAEDEGESEHVDAESGETPSLDDLGLAIEDTDNMSDAVYDGAQEDVPALEDVALEDFGTEDFGEEEPPENLESEPEETAAESPSEEAPLDDFALDDFALEDFGEEEPPENLDAEPEETVAESPSEEAPLDDFALDDFALEDFGEEEPPENLESEPEETAAENPSEEAPLDDFALEDFGEEEPLENLEVESESELEAEPESPAEEIAVDDFAIEDFDVVEPEEGELGGMEESGPEDGLISDDDVDAMFAAADAAAMEEEAAIEINTEEDMLALLDSMSNEIEAENAAAEQAAAQLAEAAAAGEDAGEEEKEGKGRKKKKRFGGKKKDGKETDTENGEGTEGGEADKKPNFFTKLIAFLTETDEDEEEEAKEGLEPSDENKSILEELEKEDKKKKKKKDKGKKGKEGKEEDGDGEEEEGKQKGKKEKKEKKKKEKKEKNAAADALETEPARPAKKVSKKSVAVIAGLCITLLAMIIVFCSIVPAFFDKKGARDAYYQSDYARAYELLYGKKLDNSDTIIYNQSKIIVEMNRKLEAYHNYLAIGEGVRALDALMMGVQKYPDIMLDAEEYHVTQEVNAIYETMLNILNDKYGITEHMAQVIIDYDDVTYTRKLESVVNGTPFTNPYAEERTSTDVLPEEQDFFTDTADTPDNVLGGREEEAGNPENQEIPQEQDTQGNETTDAQQDGSVSDTAGDYPVDTTGDTSVLPENTLEVTDTMVSQEEPAAEENPAGTDNGTDGNAVDFSGMSGTDSNSGGNSQGQMIQGIRQPLDVQIHQ